eukprot:272216-Rhodomonas_salina.2
MLLRGAGLGRRWRRGAEGTSGRCQEREVLEVRPKASRLEGGVMMVEAAYDSLTDGRNSARLCQKIVIWPELMVTYWLHHEPLTRNPESDLHCYF